jgi:hypothetical protein
MAFNSSVFADKDIGVPVLSVKLPVPALYETGAG